MLIILQANIIAQGIIAFQLSNRFKSAINPSHSWYGTKLISFDVYFYSYGGNMELFCVHSVV